MEGEAVSAIATSSLACFPLKQIFPIIINDNFWRRWTEVIKSLHTSDACGF